LDLLGWKLDLLLEHSFQLVQDDLTNNQFMLRKGQPNNIGTETSRGKSADKDIGIEKDPHDTVLNTSSSVRKPRASAKGIALWRSCSKVIKDNWRRSASRTTSLRFRLERRQNLSSI
jgi:hypothetical protein